jgi:precorrin-6B methylase 2
MDHASEERAADNDKVIERVPMRIVALDEREMISERIGIAMGIRHVTHVLIVVALIMAGCSQEKATPKKAPPRKATSQSSKPAAQPNTPASQPVAPSAAKPPAAAPAPAAPTQVAEKQAELVQEMKRPDVIFVPTPPEVVAKMLELAKVTKDDVVYDLGCGDGRIVVAAAKLGAKAYGFDVDPQRIKESKENVEKNGVGNLATIEQKDIFTLDLSNVNVVTLYLLPSLNVKLIPQLEKLKPGSRIVSHDFDMRGIKPDQVVEVTSGTGGEHTVYLWTTPLKKEQPEEPKQ